jgi:hypothetical protein
MCGGNGISGAAGLGRRGGAFENFRPSPRGPAPSSFGTGLRPSPRGPGTTGLTGLASLRPSPRGPVQPTGISAPRRESVRGPVAAPVARPSPRRARNRSLGDEF